MKAGVIFVLVAAACAARVHAQEGVADPNAPLNLGPSSRAVVAPDEVLGRTMPRVRPRDPVTMNTGMSPAESIGKTDATDQFISPGLDTTAPPPASLVVPPSVKPGPLFGGPGTNFILNVQTK
jgi:hypothetical protein